MMILRLLHSAAMRLLRSRSPHWPALEREHVRREPWCQWCGRMGSLQVHHEIPFHIDPTKELDPANLITLCMMPGRECHFQQGHRGTSWLDYDPDIRKKCEAHQRSQEAHG